MYVYIKGLLISKIHDRVIIENSGVGYELSIGSMTYNSLPGEQQDVMLYTYHYIREDKEELYGFSTIREKSLFETLISISSIGPAKAINILSQISPSDFISAVKREDIMTVSSIKGIGRKTAQRMILDLKDKITGIMISEGEAPVDKRKIEDALSGLVSLGFTDNAAREMLYLIRNEIEKTDKAEDIIKKALKKNV